MLAVNGDGGYPYAVPVNYFYDREIEADGYRVGMYEIIIEHMTGKQIQER